MDIQRAIAFIWKNARPLDRAIFEYRLRGGPAERIVAILRTYQNDDGGFGHALEADLRAPGSQPLFVEFALSVLHECGLRDAALAQRACEFVARHADLQLGIPTIFADALEYPHAPHWTNPGAREPSFERLTSLVGLLNWQGIPDPWLQEAAGVCLEHVAATRYQDAHTICGAFCLLESLPAEPRITALFDKLARELRQASFFHADAPASGYGLTPLTFAPAPQAYCRPIFSGAQLQAHLADLASKQEADGGWGITWEPPSEAARWEWRAHLTVNALRILHAYGCLEPSTLETSP